MKQQLRRCLSVIFTYDQYFIHININQLTCYHAACAHPCTMIEFTLWVVP